MSAQGFLQFGWQLIDDLSIAVAERMGQFVIVEVVEIMLKLIGNLIVLQKVEGL